MAKQEVPKRPGKDMPKEQAAMKSKSASNAESDADEEEYEDDEPSALDQWIRESPSWIVSMVFHMVLFLVLAVWTIHQVSKDKPEIVSAPVIAEEIVEEPKPEPPDPPSEEENETTEEVETSAEIEQEQVETEANDPTAKAQMLPDIPNAELTAPSSDTPSNVSGSKPNGKMGARRGLSKRHGLRGGGGGGTENAVAAGLRWLAEHQNKYGSWSFDHTVGDNCSGFENPGTVTSKMGATGLALLAFLGDGHTHKDKRSKYRGTVSLGLKYLVANSGPGGMLFEQNGERQPHMYCHGIAACAMAEAFGMTKDNNYLGPAQNALTYIAKAQHAGGGWRYQPGDEGDTSVVGWQMMAFKSGKLAYLTVPPNVYPDAAKFLDSVQQHGGGAYAYLPENKGGEINYPCAAIGLLCRNYMGWDKNHPGLKSGVKILSDKGFSDHDMYFNYYATMVMYQNDGPKGALWKRWNQRMRDILLPSQVKGNGRDSGSWHFNDAHGNQGGRVYNTALAVMMLEVYYRYNSIYGNK